MTKQQFLEHGRPKWQELRLLAEKAGPRLEGLDPGDARTMGALYRSTVADLAYATERYPNDRLIKALTDLTIEARAAIYAKRSKTMTFKSFFLTDYWRMIAEQRNVLWIALGLFLVPVLLGVVAASLFPGEVSSRMPQNFLWVTEPRPSGTDMGLTSLQVAEFSFHVMINNIQVALFAFAFGIAFGLGTAWMLAYNGFIFGALGYLAVAAGNGTLFIEAVAAHGMLELSCIVVAGVAGLRVARAVISPGHRYRRELLVEEARSAALIAWGTALFLVLAGLIEGFVSRTGTTWAPSLVIGLAIGFPFWAMVYRRRNDSEPSGRLGPEVGRHNRIRKAIGSGLDVPGAATG
ncbi:MAG: stage II sporulation protein M [Acidimicrobiia bacterium]|nr:stage II sporulation protein M [Acidimicrobiia bacterium]NNL28125.1 stage II sporulation protein M [Acidimicrobiia bacterium]